MLAFTLSPWILVQFWGLVLTPVLPGLIVCIIALRKARRGRPGARKTFGIGLALLVIGIILATWLFQNA